MLVDSGQAATLGESIGADYGRLCSCLDAAVAFRQRLMPARCGIGYLTGRLLIEEEFGVLTQGAQVALQGEHIAGVLGQD